MSTRSVTPAVAAPVAVLTPMQRPMLQRTCDCGQHTNGGECEECKKKEKMPQQRHSGGSMVPAVVPPTAGVRAQRKDVQSCIDWLDNVETILKIDVDLKDLQQQLQQVKP